MGILLKFILRNLKEKKLRTFLLVLSVAVSAALFFASGAVSDTLNSINGNRLRQAAGNADIVVTPDQNQEVSQWIDTGEADKYSGKMQFAIGTVSGQALYSANAGDMVYATLLGVSADGLKAFNPDSFPDDFDGSEFSGNKIFVSSRYAAKYAWKTGETIKLEIADTISDYKIVAICRDKGLFLNESAGPLIVMPKDTLAGIYKVGGKSDTIYIKAQNKAETTALKQDLSKIYPHCVVKDAVSQDDIDALASQVMPFKLVTIFVIFMGVFIIYTSYKVITAERLPIVGTFRSAGATAGKTGFIMILESVIFGLIGGVIGVAAGIGVLFIIACVFRPAGLKISDVTVAFSPVWPILSLAFAVVMSVISASIPVFRSAKTPLRELILDETPKNEKRGFLKAALGLIILIASMIIPDCLPDSPVLVMVVNNSCIVMALIGVILMIPLLTVAISAAISRVSSFCFGAAGGLAAKNSKKLVNTITLLAIGISCILLIYSIDESLMKEIKDSFTNSIRFDISMCYRQADSKFVNKLSSSDGVVKATGSYEDYGVEVPDKNNYINVYGIDARNYFDLCSVDFLGDAQSKLPYLNDGRNIVLSSTLKQRLHVNQGDYVKLKLKSGTESYKVIGFVNTSWNNGNVSYVSADNIKRDEKYNYYTNIYLKTDQNPALFKDKLKQTYLKDILYIQTRQEMLKANEEGVSQIFNILKSFSLLAMLIGIIGVINNLLISFIERKRYIAIYRSMGMSRSQLAAMLLIEAAVGGLLGSMFGFAAFIPIFKIIPGVLEQMLGQLKMIIPVTAIIAYLSGGFVLMLVASVIPILKSSKLSIIESIKYE